MSVDQLKQALMDNKIAERLEANDDGLVRGKNNVYPDPPGRESEPPVPQFGTAAVEAAREGREKMIGRLFNHSGSLRHAQVKTAAAADETLTQLVRRVTGLR